MPDISLGFVRRQRSAMPQWASGLTNHDYAELKEAIRLQLSGTDTPYTWNEEAGEIHFSLRGELDVVAHLSRLAIRFRDATSDERPFVVANHFRAALNIMEPLPSSWADAAPRLKAALVSPDYLADAQPDLIQRPIADEIHAVVMYQGENSLWPLTPDGLEPWGCSVDQLWKSGVANVHAEPLVKDEQTELPGGLRVHAVFGASRFVAAQVLDMPRYLDADPAFGALVAVPSESDFFTHTIRSQAYEIARNFLMKAGPEWFNGAELDRLSPHLYWWRPTGWTTLTTIVKGKLRWDPPPEFRAMAAGLPKA